MNINTDIEETETRLRELKQKREELIKLAKEEEARLEAELKRQVLLNWTPTTESVRIALKESREYKGYGGRTYESVIKDIIRDNEGEATFNENYTFKHVKTLGGGEGDGEEHWVVFSVTDVRDGSKTYWEVPGFYQSYDGGNLEWENVFQVKPVEVLVTQYQAV